MLGNNTFYHKLGREQCMDYRKRIIRLTGRIRINDYTNLFVIRYIKSYFTHSLYLLLKSP